MKYSDIKVDLDVVIIQPSRIKLPDGVIEDQSNMWKAKVISMVEGSRTKVIVKDVERGVGWCNDTRSYKGVNIGLGWYKGENKGFGDELEIHIKYVNKI